MTQWLLVIYAGVSSTVFLILSYQRYFQRVDGADQGNHKYFALGFVVIAQTTLVVLAKVNFFSKVLSS